LHIHRLTLSHFRSHKHTQVQAENGPIALFGSNGAGKTNIIEAISLLSPGRGLRRASTAELSKSPDNIGWKLNAEVISDVNSNLLKPLGQIPHLELSRLMVNLPDKMI